MVGFRAAYTSSSGPPRTGRRCADVRTLFFPDSAPPGPPGDCRLYPNALRRSEMPALIPICILGLPFLGLLFLSAIYRGGTSAFARSGPHRGGVAARDGGYREPAMRSPELELISRLSGPVDPGAIRRLSGPVSPGAIARLSGRRSPGAIAKLSGHVSPGAISRLSGPKSPGAISRLSAPRPVGSIRTLSAGFYVSTLFGLPLLTRSPKPLEPDGSLLAPDRRPRGER